VNDADAAENAVMALDEHLEKIQELHGLSQRELAPFRLVTNTFTNVSNSVKRNAKILSPGSGDPEWVNKRRERDRKLQKWTDGPIRQSRKSEPVESIELYNREKENIEENNGRPVASRTRIRPNNTTTAIPRPCNGYQFECIEAMKILARAPNKSPLLLHWHDKGWIPVKPRRCYALLKKHEDGVSVVWGGIAVDGTSRGRRTFCSTKEFLDGCSKIQEAKHRVITLEDVKEVLTTINQKHCEDNGIWAFGRSTTPSIRTIARYFSFAADEMNVKLTNGVVQAKTNTRYTAENSLMSAMSFLLIQATSGLIIGEPHSKTTPLETATEGARPLAALVSKANGNVSVYPVQPGMITTTDDTTVFACAGIAQSGATEWKLLDADETYSNRSAYVVDKDGAQNRFFSGQRIRLTQTMAGNGRMAPIFATMTGLSADELPADTCPSGIYFLEVPGLCFGGSDVRAEGRGTVAFG
jgi:hypothetical protein